VGGVRSDKQSDRQPTSYSCGNRRDYSDVPPTRGVFKGEAKSELSVAVQVAPSSAPLPEDKLPVNANWLVADRGEPEEPDYEQQWRKRQQQEQQQQ